MVGWEGGGLEVGMLEKGREYGVKREEFGRGMGKLELVEEEVCGMVGKGTG